MRNLRGCDVEFKSFLTHVQMKFTDGLLQGWWIPCSRTWFYCKLALKITVSWILKYPKNSGENGYGTPFRQVIKLWSFFQRIDVREYCNDEHFSANCTEGSVVLMNSAVYGSMRKGNCLRSHVIVDGCGTNVLPAMDSLCSGRQSCHFRVPNDELRRARNCSKEIALYLEASYSCLTGQNLHISD